MRVSDVRRLRWTAVVLSLVLAVTGRATAVAQGPGGQDPGDGGLPAGSQMLRGTVTAATADAITVKTESGEVYKITATTNTRVMKARQPAKLGEIKAGDGVGAMGVMDAPSKTLHAMFVTVIDAEQIKRAQAELGKSYIAGQITAIDHLKLTIKRPDGVAQTIEVDEGTSFRKGGGRGMGMMGAGGGSAEPAGGGGDAQGRRGTRAGDGGGAGAVQGGESITLADLKVGDAVAARGALKSGVFVPTELRVLDAARARRRGGVNGAASGNGGTTPAGPPPGGVGP